MKSNSNARESAIELVKQFEKHTNDRSVAIECALIALNELREATYGGYDYDAGFELPFYDEIEKEIKKMPIGKLYYMDFKYGKDEGKE